MHTLYPVNHLTKATTEYFGTTLCFIQIAKSVVEKSQILSVAFHLATTVHSQAIRLFGKFLKVL